MIPDEIRQKLIEPACILLSAPFPNIDPMRSYFELQRRVEKVLQEAYSAGYAQRDAEILLGQIKAE